MTDLGSLSGGTTIATAINDQGDVVGDEDGPAGLRAVLWRHGAMTILRPLNGGMSRAYDINNRGVVVGESFFDMTSAPVQWRLERPARLAGPGSGPATAINDRGQSTGFDDAGAYLWHRGVTTRIGTAPGSTSSQAMGLNNRGVVVGFTDLGAFRWSRGTLTMLPSLTGSITSALDINDRGQIVGLSATTPDEYHLHAVLWTR
jgi:uncharacterized membrane protein